MVSFVCVHYRQQRDNRTKHHDAGHAGIRTKGYPFLRGFAPRRSACSWPAHDHGNCANTNCDRCCVSFRHCMAADRCRTCIVSTSFSLLRLFRQLSARQRVLRPNLSIQEVWRQCDGILLAINRPYFYCCGHQR